MLGQCEETFTTSGAS
jgi:hypothetical protein